MPRHALAREHAARILALAGRALGARGDRVAVRLAVRGKVVALDHPGEALADGGALHVHPLTHLEDLYADLAANLEAGQLIRLGAELPQAVARFHRRLGEMAGERLADAARAPLAERDLHGRIAVLV